MSTITASDLTLPADFTPYETQIVVDALNVAPGPNQCADLMAYCNGKTFHSLPLDVLLHGLAEKESTFRQEVVGIEKDLTEAWGLFQFHATTLQPFLDALDKSDWGEHQFLADLPTQVECVILLMARDYDGKDVMSAFKEFGAHTQRIMAPIVQYYTGGSK